MSLRIAFDLDGVLADMESELARLSEMLFGEPNTPGVQGLGDAGPGSGTGDANDAAPEHTPDATTPVIQLELTPRQQRRLWQHVRSIDNFWEGLEEIERGVVGRLGTLATARRWEIIFLTKRPDTAGATAQVQTQRWLEAKGFVLPSVFVVQGSRGRIADALGLDIVVDDRPENCLDVMTDSKARAILVQRAGDIQPPTAQRLGIGVVKSVADCLEVLTQAEAATRDEPGVMTRLLRLLGLKEPASR